MGTTTGMPNPMSNGSPLAIEKLAVRADRIVATVRCSGARRTTPDLARAALDRFPNLARHACVNRKGATFGDVIESTPLPHLLEHVAIDLLISRSAAADAVFTGTSEWTDKEEGLASVAISYTDDLEGLAALRDAADAVNQLARAMHGDTEAAKM